MRLNSLRKFPAIIMGRKANFYQTSWLEVVCQKKWSLKCCNAIDRSGQPNMLDPYSIIVQKYKSHKS